jgi:hypothetical protein
MEIVKRLPKEIRLHIIPYTYHLQPKPLLRDIEHFKETQTILFRMYWSYWGEIQPGEDKNWLINDMFSYANHYKATMYGFVDNFYRIFRRNKRLNTVDEIHRYIRKIEEKPADTQINIVLGLFTLHERTDLVIDLYTHLSSVDPE